MFPPSAAKNLIHPERGPGRPQSRTRRPPRTGSAWVIGFLTADMDAPADALGPATTATIATYVFDDDDYLVALGGDDEVLTNISTDLSAEEGTLVIAARMFGRLIPVWVDCGTSLESSSSS